MWDVIVCGAGNAGLCAAISAKQHGASVLVIEKAPRLFRGGNSSLTKNFRFPTECLADVVHLLDDPTDGELARLGAIYRIYSVRDFRNDLLRCSYEKGDPALIAALATGSRKTIDWLHKLGHRWEVKPESVSTDSSLPIRLRGGGKALQERSFELAGDMGIPVQYDSALLSARRQQSAAGLIFEILVSTATGSRSIHSRTLVLSTGGFQANCDMVEMYIGPKWRNVRNRGTPYNTGVGLQAGLSLGGTVIGIDSGCHSSPQSIDMPDFVYPGDEALSQANSRYCFNFGITVNRFGRRFFDEGRDLTSFTYAEVGRKIVEQDEGKAFQIFDSTVIRYLPKGYFADGRLLRSNSLRQLGRALGIDENQLPVEVAAYNDQIALGCSDSRRNYRRTIESPPFYGTPVRAGLTFTYPGIRIDTEARVVTREDIPITGLFACGEIVGGLFYGGYPGGSGLMAGSHFGRIAGVGAASFSDSLKRCSDQESLMQDPQSSACESQRTQSNNGKKSN